MNLMSELVTAADVESAIEMCFERNWTDGLPVVPPTPHAVERIIAYLGRDPQDVIGVIPPRDGVATIETIAINCVMAGCKPEYVPIVIAALEAVLEERFNINAVQTTTHSCAPLLMVSGAAVKKLAFNTRECVFGHGCRPSATIGRALRLVLWNIGGGYPRDPCKTTHGHPGYFTFCIAEDPDSNPWQSLHVDRGFQSDDTVVTVTATEGPHLCATGAGLSPAEDVLIVLADGIARLGGPGIGGGDLVLVLGPMAARNLADAGLSKIDVKRELMRLATWPVRDLQHRRSMPASHPWHWSRLVDAHDEEARVPYIRSVENLIILVAGGWGSKGGITSICPGWGMHGGLTVSKRVIFPSG